MIVYANHIYRIADHSTEALLTLLEKLALVKMKWTPYISPENRRLRQDAAKALCDYIGCEPHPGIGDVVIAYRGTNRAQEYDDVKSGMEIISRNHATGELEKGISVALGLHTVWAYQYDYVYQIQGRIVDFGSDGEPVLQDTRPTGPLISAEEAITWDWREGPAAQKNKLLTKLTEQTSWTVDELNRLLIEYGNE